jgi:hypothetical protein
MLSTLLPGVRELRAPLAAGYILLLAAWIALEPRIPEAAEATGLVATLYRLNDALSGFGLAAAATFAAYLIGSLSITLLSPPLRGRFVGVPRSAASLGPLEPLSDQGTTALLALVRRTWNQMATTLALTDVSPEDVLELEGISGEGSASSGPPKLGVSFRKPPNSRFRRLVNLPLDTVRRLGVPAPTIRFAGATLSFDRASELDLRQVRLVRVVVGEFDQIIRTRLLGRDPDLYSAVDRHRAEVDFRIAVIPPLAVLSLVLAARVDPWAIPIVIVAGLLACFGLFWDARERERKANDILSGALMDTRVNSPTLQSLEQRTSTIAKQPRAEKMQQAAADAVRVMGELIDMLERIDSNLTRAEMVKQTAQGLRDRTAPVEGFFSSAVVSERDRALDKIEHASELWSQAFGSDEPVELMEQARVQAAEAKESYSGFRRAAVNEIERAGAEPVASAASGSFAEEEASPQG